MRNGKKVNHLVQNYTGVIVGKTKLRNLFEDKNNDTEYRVKVEGSGEIRVASINNLEEIHELIPIKGTWDEGFSLQLHTLSSTLVGINEYGYNEYENKYSEIGKLLKQCKYNKNLTAIPKLARIVIQRFKEISSFDALIPVPPTNQNRNFQPVSEIASLICKEAGIEFLDGIFEVRSHPELKNVIEKQKRIEFLRNSVCLLTKPDIEKKKVLVFDDLYRSGSTLSIICDLLKPLAPNRVCVLTLTKTRTKK